MMPSLRQPTAANPPRERPTSVLRAHAAVGWRGCRHWVSLTGRQGVGKDA